MKFALFGQYYQNSTETTVLKVIAFFIENNCEVVIEENFYKLIASFLPKKFSVFSNHTELDASFTAFVSIGGDGTILRAVTYVRDKNIPIVGINTGRLGFLATVQLDNIEPLLTKVIAKEYSISKRSLITLRCEPKNPDLADLNFALNEITVSRKETTSMITIETYLNQEYLTSYWADGLILATPTGSTGYSLSCGGPIVTPSVNSFIINPIAPHNLNARPLVITDDTEISLKISGREDAFLVSLDSRITSVNNQTTLYIKKASFYINLIEFKEEDFSKTIRKKLLWGEDKRN
ncbi:NAD kinase [Flavobacterium sp.]|uniref:NAD kinase n=1 Tax=Flavobacterium sp. TaxID=239 RepID=UPI0035274AD2